MVNPLSVFGFPNWAWDIIALIITFLAIMVLIRVNDVLRKRELVPTFVSRKVIHTFAGPVFLVCWLLFSSDAWSRYFAAVVPLIFVFLFLTIGLGIIKNEEFVRTMSRSGDPRELLKGTLFYALVMVVCAIVFWYVPFTSTGAPQYAVFVPTTIFIFGPLAGGDGFADMIGRKWGKHRFKVFAEKSVEGSLAMFIFGIIFTYALLGIYWIVLDWLWNITNVVSLAQFTTLTIIILVTSLVATIAEIISPKGFDNLVIPIVIGITIYAMALTGLYYYCTWSLFVAP